MKKVFLSLVAILAIILVIAAILPKDFKIEKEIVINKPRNEVFNYLKTVKNENEWNPWMQKDANMIQSTQGEDGTTGFVYSWSGNTEVGVGEQEIKNIALDERIDFELRFKEPMQATNQAYYITTDANAGQTRVVWGMTGRTPFPYNLMCHLMRGKVNKEFENGLKNLKIRLEK